NKWRMQAIPPPAKAGGILAQKLMKNNPKIWKRDTLMFVLCLLVLSLSFSASAQSQNDQMARAYYFEAENAVAKGELSNALTAITKAEELLGASNASTTAMKVKIYFGQGKYQTAKRELSTFYNFKAGNNLAREMAPYLTKIDKKITEEKARIVAEKQAAIVKLEQARQAGIAAKDARILAEERRQAQAKRNRLAQLAQQKSVEKQAIQDQFQSCENGYSTFNCFAVAERYEFGRDGYLQDLEKASLYYGKSCRPKELDKHKGCFGRVRLLSQGHGISESSKSEIREIVFLKRRHDGYRSGNGVVDGADWNYLSGQIWQKRTNDTNGNPFYKSNSIVAAFYFNKSCKIGNKDGCNAAKQVTPDKLQQALDMYVTCKRGPSNKGIACYEFAKAIDGDENIYKYLRGEYPHYAVSQYWKKHDLRIYPAKVNPRFIEPNKFYDLACDEYKHPDACFRNAESTYEYAKKYTFSFESWVTLLEKYKISCETKIPIPSNKELACSRREKIKEKLKQDFSFAKDNCLTPTIYGAKQDCLKIASAYKLGFMVPVDQSREFEYLLRACKHGGWSDCRKAAEYAEDIEGTLPADFENVAEFYGKACKSHPSLFCVRLGDMYIAGEGVEQDTSMAKSYYKIYLKRQKKICKGAGKDSDDCKKYKDFKEEYRKKF
ncbi:hypothetical protein CXF72_00270, partial [Psychromonas sp. MB-3u-54]|uniref:hypothetical protein n=1 Tax=Psychromonas sp. MB-3u-54 TaxID=2058319 RepID=UPI000CAD567C